MDKLVYYFKYIHVKTVRENEYASFFTSPEIKEKKLSLRNFKFAPFSIRTFL